MTPATGLTIARLGMAPIFSVFLLREEARSLWIAAGIFVLAALTDKADGWLARRTGTVTQVGRMLDPLADKLLVALALLSFALMQVPGVELWMVAAILGRELLVMLLRSAAGRRGVPVPVSQLSKWKTTLQMAFVVLVLVMMSIRAMMDPAPAFWKDPGGTLRVAVQGAMLLTTFVTVLSGADYAWRARTAFLPPRGVDR